MEYQIQYKKKKDKYGFIGMNKYASKAHNIPYNHKKPAHTLTVYKKVPHSVRVATINHEKCEAYLMKNKHMSYRKAHYNALRFENTGKPFPKTRIKENLKKMGFRVIK